MAHRKRSRDINDLDGEEVEVESASSSLRQSIPTKRSRLAIARENGGSVVSDDDDDEPLDSEMGEDGLAAFDTQDSDDDANGVDDIQATQIVQKQYRNLKENMASEQGVIEEVFCRNFMCHAKLRIKLGPLINFIVGHNGSGKSAVLTALQVCLGGKVRATNRGKKLSDYIKEGEDTATVAVKVKNQGDGAYKPDIYGRSITVERHFTRAGASSFKMKNESDKIISTKKGDLDDILDFFAFQLDNPINVLTQDMARQFLSNSSPSEKYKFFIRGTQLEVLDGDYKLLEEHLDNIEAKLHTRQQDIAVLKQNMDEAEARKKRLEHTASIQEKITRLTWQHAWLQVEEQENIQAKIADNLETAKKNVQEKSDAAEAFDGAYEGHNQTFEASRRALHDLQEQLRPIEDQYGTERDNLRSIEAEQSEILSQERDCKGEITNIKKRMDRLEKDIAQEQALLRGAEGDEHAERMATLEELKSEVEAKRQEQVDHAEGHKLLESNKAEAIQKLQANQRPLQQRKEAVEKAEGTLHRLQNNQGRQFAPYRDRMEDLVHAVSRETRWRTKPAGPMGMHIRITKPEWTSPIERTLGGNMEAFIVTCKQDQEILSQIMNRVNCRSPILISSATPLDTTGKEPTGDVDTILRVLQVDNDLVRNSLIINQAADQTVLISDRNKAYAFMYPANGQKPQNVKVTMSFAADRGAAIRYEYTGRGASKSSNVPPWQGPPRMKSDIQDQIRITKETLNQATRDMEETRAEDRRLQEAKKSTESAIKNYDNQAKRLRLQFQKAEDAVEAQMALIESNRPEDGKLQELEVQLEEAHEEDESHRASFQDIVIAKDAAHQKAQEAKSAFESANTERDQAMRNIEKAEKRLQKLEDLRRKALQEKNEAIQLIDVAAAEQKKLEDRLASQEAHVQEFVEEANKISVRIPIDTALTPDIIDNRIERLEQDKARAEREAGGTREELVTAWQRARQAHMDAESQLQGMVRFSGVSLGPGPICTYKHAKKNDRN